MPWARLGYEREELEDPIAQVRAVRRRHRQLAVGCTGRAGRVVMGVIGVIGLAEDVREKEGGVVDDRRGRGRVAQATAAAATPAAIAAAAASSDKAAEAAAEQAEVSMRSARPTRVSRPCYSRFPSRHHGLGFVDARR